MNRAILGLGTVLFGLAAAAALTSGSGGRTAVATGAPTPAAAAPMATPLRPPSVGSAALATAPPLLRQELNYPYDGRFTFVRIRYEVSMRSFGRRGGGGLPPWAHDYPRAERNFMQILSETTSIDPHMGGGNILTTDDPELFRYPIVYLSEPGEWHPSDREVEGLRAYLLKGGFLILDDFRGGDIYNLDEQIKRVLPGLRMQQLDVSHPVFNSFYAIKSLDFAAPTFQQLKPVFLGIHEDNDPDKRLMVIANYNNDIGEYWEWSDAGFIPIELSNEAYKLGVNYLVYAMTH